LSYGNLKPTMRHGKMIDIKFQFKTKKSKLVFSLYFRDSYLLIPVSLKDLGKNFNVENKGLFPLFFVNNPEIPLDYIGDVPDFKYFNEKGYTMEYYEENFRDKNPKYIKYKGPTPEEYKEYCKEFTKENP
jgi:hypothetical protein